MDALGPDSNKCQAMRYNIILMMAVMINSMVDLQIRQHDRGALHALCQVDPVSYYIGPGPYPRVICHLPHM